MCSLLPGAWLGGDLGCGHGKSSLDNGGGLLVVIRYYIVLGYVQKEQMVCLVMRGVIKFE